MLDTSRPVLARSARECSYAMLRRTEDPVLTRRHSNEYFPWMTPNKEQASVVLSGTVEPATAVALDGLMIIRTSRRKDGKDVADRNRLSISALAACSLDPSSMIESGLTLDGHVSDRTGALR